jgi:hypothetical protein
MQAAHEEQQLLAAQIGITIEEGSRVHACWRRCCAQAGDRGTCPIERKGLRCEQFFLLAGEQDGARVT